MGKGKVEGMGLECEERNEDGGEGVVGRKWRREGGEGKGRV